MNAIPETHGKLIPINRTHKNRLVMLSNSLFKFKLCSKGTNIIVSYSYMLISLLTLILNQYYNATNLSCFSGGDSMCHSKTRSFYVDRLKVANFLLPQKQRSVYHFPTKGGGTTLLYYNDKCSLYSTHR